MPYSKQDIETASLDRMESMLKEFNDRRTDLRSEEWALQNRWRELVKQKLKPYVGKCYSFQEKYWCIVDVPREEYTMTTVIFNEYQLPALVIDMNGKTPEETIFSDTFFRGNFPEEPATNPFSRQKALEISKEAFLIALQEAYKKYEELVIKLG